jgi:hypothetical protein
MDTEADDDTLVVLGVLRPPREHALALLEAMRAAGLDGKCLLQEDLAAFHLILCEARGWMPRRWLSVGRELKRLGIRRGKEWNEGRRRTVYEIGEPLETVVEFAAVGLKCANAFRK